MIRGIHQVVLEVDDQDRALSFWTEALRFALVQDAPYGDERRLEVRTPGGAATIVLTLRNGPPPTAPAALPTSNRMFYCDDLAATYEEPRLAEASFHSRRSTSRSEGRRSSRTPRATASPLPPASPRNRSVISRSGLAVSRGVTLG